MHIYKLILTKKKNNNSTFENMLHIALKTFLQYLHVQNSQFVKYVIGKIMQDGSYLSRYWMDMKYSNYFDSAPLSSIRASFWVEQCIMGYVLDNLLTSFWQPTLQGCQKLVSVLDEP